MNNIYNFKEHNHLFACWTAARAASIGRFTNNQVSQMIDEIKLNESLLLKKKGKPQNYKKALIANLDRFEVKEFRRSRILLVVAVNNIICGIVGRSLTL